jgi:hypothetical protein
MRKRYFTVATALAVGCLGLLAASQAAGSSNDVSDQDAAVIVGGQSGQCGTSSGTQSTGCNTSTSSWKPWDGCTSGPFLTGSGSGQNVYVTSSCYSGCGNYCGSVTTNNVCGTSSGS